jgi:hypothetical protein
MKILSYAGDAVIATRDDSHNSTCPDSRSVKQKEAVHPWVRALCRLAALALGVASAWATRYTMYPDGVSYLDVGDAFWRGDWYNAVNAYWSPLYPGVLGLFLKLFKPSIHREYPLVHLVNFLSYVVALVCFDFFLRAFLSRLECDREPASQSKIGLPWWAWWVVGYSIFVTSSLLLITISFVSGDMIVAAVIYFASALILKLQREGASASGGTFAWLGLILAVGYLAKAVMFLMSLPFIAVAVATQESKAQKIRCATVAFGFFLAVAAPFVLLLSSKQGRPTFGDSGKINYLMNVGRTQFFTPHEETAKHPVRKLTVLPNAYEYGNPIHGTYPLWYDPSYWHDGIQAHVDLKRQVRRLFLATAQCLLILFSPSMGLGITVAVLFLYLVSPSVSRYPAHARSHWALWTPALAGIALYSLVVIEPRYVAALFSLVWVIAFSGVRLADAVASRRLITGTVLAVAAVTSLTTGWQISQALDGSVFAQRDVATPLCTGVAEALAAQGIKPGDKIAVISTWLFPSRQGAYIARLTRARIIGEARSDEYWAADAPTRSELELEFAQAGARAILSNEPPHVGDDWERLASTDYYLRWLNTRK